MNDCIIRRVVSSQHAFTILLRILFSALITILRMFKALIHEPTDENDHVPFIEISENKVSIRCGYNALHSMKPEHFIGWIKLFGVKGDKQIELGSAQFWPEHAEPVALFSVTDIA